MELSISNNFLSLFIPEQSDFSSNEIIEEFKVYIFKLMNMNIESLIQEQLNNENESILLQKKYKDFFSGKATSVLQINNLYKSIKDRSILISNAIDENLTIIERNKTSNVENILTLENEKLMQDFRTNKKIIKNFPNDNLLKLFFVPYYMVNAFQNNDYQSYFKYYKYITEKVPDKFPTLNKLKKLVEYIHNKIVVFIKNLLSIDYDIKIPYEDIFDLAQLKQNNIFSLPEDENKNNNLPIDKEIKILTIYLLQIDLYTTHHNISINKNNSNYDNNNTNNSENNEDIDEDNLLKILNFFEKIIKNVQKKISNKLYTEKFYVYLFQTYIYDYVNYIFSVIPYFKANNKLNVFINNIKLVSISNNIFNTIYKISKNFFIKNFNSLIQINENIINNYISSNNNIKKFFECVIPVNVKTSSNKDLMDLKYEIFVIFYNNLSFLEKNILDEKNFIFTDKVRIIKIFMGHCNNLIGLLIDFLNEHGISIINDQNLVKEYNEFKNILNKIMKKFCGELIECFGIDNKFDYLFMLNNLNKFNNLLQDIQELI